MKRIVLHLCLLIALAFPVSAQDRPSWAIIDAVDRLISQNALFLSSRDGFVKFPNGKLVHYELPSKNYIKDGAGWQVELLSRRWRKKEQNVWSPWLDARPEYSTWKIGVIHVDVLPSGVRAVWVENSNFAGATPPIEAEVMRQLNTQGLGYVASPAPPLPPPQEPMISTGERVTRSSSSFTRQSSTTSGALPSGMSRVIPQPQPLQSTASSSPQNTSRPFNPRPPVPWQVPPPSVNATSPPQASGYSSPSASAGLIAAPTRSFEHAMPFLIAAAVVASALPYAFKKTKRPHSRRPVNGRKTSRPPSLPADPLDLIQRSDNLLTPAELAFFAALKPLIHSSYHLSAKVRLADLFNAANGRGRQTAFNKIVGKHIDFVVTDSVTSRILCGIELDDNSHQRPDRVERDRFVNEVFARNQLPLLRIPFSWTYYPAGLRTKLANAGLNLPAEI